MRSWWRKICAGGAGLCACVADDGTTAIFRFWGCAGSRDLFDGMGNSRSAREDLAGGIYGFDVVARTRSGPRGSSVAGPVYNWFTEGFDAPVLQDAKALLDQLA
jgi:hypothetical protein